MSRRVPLFLPIVFLCPSGFPHCFVDVSTLGEKKKGWFLMSRAKTTNFQGIPTQWRIKPAADEKAPTSSEIRFTSAGSGDAVADRILSQPGVPPVLKISMSTGEAEVIPAASPAPVAAQSAAIAEGEPMKMVS